MALERIIRPAQTPNNQPVQTFRQRRSARNWQPVILKFSGGGNPVTGSGSYSQTVNYYAKKRPKETKPKT